LFLFYFLINFIFVKFFQIYYIFTFNNKNYIEVERFK